MKAEFELLRDLAVDWEPPPLEVAEAARRSRLRMAIADEVSRPAERGIRLRLPRLSLDLRLRPLAQFGLAVLVLVLVITSVSGLLAPPPAVARLSELAVAARRVPIESLGEGEFAYTFSVGESLHEIPDPATPGAFIAFRVASMREEWRGADGSGLLRITSGAPVFLDPEREVLPPEYADAFGVDRTIEVPFGPGTRSGLLTDLPTDVIALETALLREVEKGPRLRPEDVAVFDLAGDRLRAVDASPELRAALFGLLARLDGVRLVPTEPGRTTLAIEFDVEGGSELITLTFVDETTALVAESTVRTTDFPPPGTSRRLQISRVDYSEVTVVDRIG